MPNPKQVMSAMQAINKAKGGAMRMQVGGLSALAKLGKAGAKSGKAEEAAMRAPTVVNYADPLAPASMRMSEALGNAGAEGKTLNFTEADRSRVFGKNRGGVGFAGLQHYSIPHKKANTVWGFGNTATAEKKIRQNDPENSLWTTFVGSPTQHRSNSVVIGDAIKEFQKSVKQGVVPREQIMLMNKRLNELTDKKTGERVFENGFDLTDSSALDVANTFSRRAAVGDVMLGLGVKGPMSRLDFKKEFPDTKFTDGSNIGNILKRETDPDLVDAGTYDVGNRLFVMDGKIIQRPDLNEAFPEQVTGYDLGMKYQLVPPDKAMRDFYKAREGRLDKNDKPSPVSYYDLSRAKPSQKVDEDYLTFLQKEGYKDGGSAEPKPFHDFDQIMKRKDGGTVNTTFEQRLKSAIDQHMAVGGVVERRYAEAGSVPPLTPQEIEQTSGAQGAAFGVFPQMASQRFQQTSPTMDKASEMLKAQVTKEWEQAGRPGGAKELSLRISAVLAGGVPDFVNFAQSMIPALNEEKPSFTTVLDSGKKPPAPYRDTREMQTGLKYPMSGTSTDIKNSMREKGIINEDEYPLAEILGAFAAPYALAKAPKAIKGGLNMVKPVIKEAGDMASRAVVPMRRQFEPSTFTVESTADDLGQNTTYGFRQGLNDVLLGNPNLGTGKNKSREAVGTFMNPNKLINPKGLTEINPMMAIDVRGAGTIGNVPSANKALRKQVGQLGEDLNQTSMAGHRFIPLMTNNIKDASSMLIKTPQGLNKDEIKQLAVLLGDDMVLAHNPRLGGVVVMPFGRVEKGQIPEEFLKAQSAASEVLGKRGKIKFGVSDFDKDRLFMEKTKGDYIQASAQPMSKEQQAQRERLQGLEKFLFPQSRSGIPGQVKAAPVGGLQPWSVGSDYPTSVIGIGNGSRVQYQPRNFSTGKEGSRYDTYMDAERERAQMLDEFHRTLVPKYR